MANSEGKVNIIIIAAIVMANLLLSVGFYFFVIKKSDADPKKEAAAKKAGDSEESSSESEGSDENKEKENPEAFGMHNMEDLVINPKDGDGRFLVITMGFEFDKMKYEKLEEELKAKDIVFKDSFNTYFASLSMAELQNIENRQKIKEDIKKMVNKDLSEGKIKKVLFSQFVIQ